ncbi:MAG TPA: sulfatase-like hydrolase/transferase [Anaeromyxobacteraceae bacterium]|nr:sulfatase-like hydrolase/transferase [Anaeromyxobacteraceae bacterium]
MSGSWSAEPASPRPTGLRWPALLWALLHVPLVLLLFSPAILPALAEVGSGFRLALWPALALQAIGLTLLGFALGLPLSVRPRLYRVAAPALLALGLAVLALDAQIFIGTNFHMNRFVLRSLFQPSALREIGIPAREAAVAAAVGLAFIVADTAAGAWFLRRFASARRAWPLALALAGAVAAERLFTAAMVWTGGGPVLAASQSLPLQPPLPLGPVLDRIAGRPSDPLRGLSLEGRGHLPPGATPASVRFQRRPDVVLALVESLRAEFLEPDTMPRTSERARSGAVFERHVAAASATTYTVFGLLYGLEARNAEAVLASGRPPLLFGALKANGYRVHILAASSVDWMGLKETAFAEVAGDLETAFPGASGSERDEVLMARARAFLESAGDEPLFLMLFFDGTHFGYSYPLRSARLEPVWDGQRSLEATRAPGHLIERRARNAAYEVDWKLDELLRLVEARRGRRPLVFLTGDHAEEYKEKGRLGHGSGVNREQVHVPMAVMGEGVPPLRHDGVTSHVDFVPTLFRLLGDRTPPERYADGVDMLQASPDRFAQTTVGWQPVHALVSRDLKVAFGGLQGTVVTDFDDRPLEDGSARAAARLGELLRALGRSPAMAMGR